MSLFLPRRFPAHRLPANRFLVRWFSVRWSLVRWSWVRWSSVPCFVAHWMLAHWMLARRLLARRLLAHWISAARRLLVLGLTSDRPAPGPTACALTGCASRPPACWQAPGRGHWASQAWMCCPGRPPAEDPRRSLRLPPSRQDRWPTVPQTACGRGHSQRRGRWNRRRSETRNDAQAEQGLLTRRTPAHSAARRRSQRLWAAFGQALPTSSRTPWSRRSLSPPSHRPRTRAALAHHNGKPVSRSYLRLHGAGQGREDGPGECVTRGGSGVQGWDGD
jgi:hypothetical protein